MRHRRGRLKIMDTPTIDSIAAELARWPQHLGVCGFLGTGAPSSVARPDGHNIRLVLSRQCFYLSRLALGQTPVEPLPQKEVAHVTAGMNLGAMLGKKFSAHAGGAGPAAPTILLVAAHTAYNRLRMWSAGAWVAHDGGTQATVLRERLRLAAEDARVGLPPPSEPSYTLIVDGVRVTTSEAVAIARVRDLADRFGTGTSVDLDEWDDAWANACAGGEHVRELLLPLAEKIPCGVLR